MTSSFQSILFPPGDAARATIQSDEPTCFRDLNLDQVVSAITAGRDEYDLKPFYYTALRHPATIEYRQAILHDLERPPVVTAVQVFARTMRTMRDALAQSHKAHYVPQRERWFLDAATIYCDAVTTLAEDLSQTELTSPGLQAFLQYLQSYLASGAFTRLHTEASALQEALTSVRYTLHIRGGRVTVSRYEQEPDYSAEIEEVFAKFRRGAAKDYRVRLPEWPEMDHIEARILELAGHLYPEVFVPLHEFCTRHHDFVDDLVRRFDREVQFYLAYLEYISRFQHAGLAFCYPDVSAGSKTVAVTGAFDIALAQRLLASGEPVVLNDFELRGPERILVVTGPNQGGKTTFARMFGQIHYLGSLGLPVPATTARLVLPDRLFTHFEREEHIANLRGKLEDELARFRDILDQATERSIVIMNESFSATTLDDTIVLGTAILRQLIARNLIGVYVTFIDELTTLGPETVSMVSTVEPDNPAQRTFRIVRKPADGLAYAAVIAEKYHLTYDALRRRIAENGRAAQAAPPESASKPAGVMKVFLMYRRRDVDEDGPLPPHAETLASDLELTKLLDAMSGGDAVLYEVARKALLSSLTDPDAITYRQQILSDCLDFPDIVRQMYEIAVAGVQVERNVRYGWLRDSPGAILSRSVQMMELYAGLLRRLRSIADTYEDQFRSEGFHRFFAMLRHELDDAYFARIAEHLAELKLRNGVVMSAGLGSGNKPARHILHRLPRQTWLQRLMGTGPAHYSFTVPDRDESGFRSLEILQGKGLNAAANALAQSADHIRDFFSLLRTELAFYLGCLNLHERLRALGGPMSFPVPLPADRPMFTARDLYDPSLALHLNDLPVTNDVTADDVSLVMITGANQGGKTTFLRSVGLAQLMMQCGLFVPATSFRANVCQAIFTHFKREEDPTMKRGKFEEELSRMSDISARITPACLLLCNESFSATNEREGSEIALHVIRALLAEGIKVFFVTHLSYLARQLWTQAGDGRVARTVFLRAERLPDGRRTFRIVEGEPLSTSYGADAYQRVFGAAPGVALTHLAAAQAVSGVRPGELAAQ
jgi:DNA mismatch repair ATPase MutS